MEETKWRFFSPTFTLQILVFIYCVYYEILAAASLFTGLYKLSTFPSSGKEHLEHPHLLLLTRVSAWIWLASGIHMFVTGVTGKIAARTCSRVLLSVFTLAQGAAMGLLVGTAIYARTEVSLPDVDRAVSLNKDNHLSAQLLEKAQITAGAVAGSIGLGIILSVALLVLAFRRKKDGEIPYRTMVELE
ncbi:hypothetical protein RvY_14431 [Ramazzottius varieornatus]|uniref:Uncharacterized protein n=1 Tax=Ramazzottius varieornatus TaxID=947166 RepID=A0A1D1VRA5_RAMVA|nr:hypothetical protein RvY_14431 [Ramazzottius varieornatus]